MKFKFNPFIGNFDSVASLGQEIELAKIGSSTYKTVQDMQDLFHSAGWVSGGTVTDNGDLTVSISAGTGFIRATDSDVAQILFFDWAALADQSIPADSTRWILVSYNAGSPVVSLAASDTTDNNTSFLLAVVTRDDSELHITPHKQSVGNHAGLMIERMHETMHIERDNVGGGLILGETGTRNITVTAGALWMGLERTAISATDTSGAGTFDRWYRDGVGGWTKENNQTQWNNTQYDDGTGTLATMSANKYSVQYFWQEMDGDITSVYGQAEYNTLANALEDEVPGTLPPRLQNDHAVLIGRLIFQKSAATAAEIETSFVMDFRTAGVNNHNDLAGLQGGTTGEYYHLTSAQHTYVAAISTAEATLTDGASIDWNLSTQQTAKVTLGGNRTLALPTSIVAGGIYTLTVIQDATGTRTLAWNAGFLFPAGIDPILSTGANDIDIFQFKGHGTTQLILLSASFDVS